MLESSTATCPDWPVRTQTHEQRLLQLPIAAACSRLAAAWACLLATRSQRLQTSAAVLNTSCSGRCSNISPRVASSSASAMPRALVRQLSAAPARCMVRSRGWGGVATSQSTGDGRGRGVSQAQQAQTEQGGGCAQGGRGGTSSPGPRAGGRRARGPGREEPLPLGSVRSEPPTRVWLGAGLLSDQ